VLIHVQPWFRVVNQSSTYPLENDPNPSNPNNGLRGYMQVSLVPQVRACCWR
jgi:hypothetical protein